MPNTSNLEVHSALPSWTKCACQAHIKETITELCKRGFLAISVSFFPCAVRVHLIASCCTIADFPVCVLRQEVFTLGAGNGGPKSPVPGSMCFPLCFLGLHKNWQVNTFFTQCFGNDLCVTFDFGSGARPLHANFRPLSAVFKTILVTVLNCELSSASFPEFPWFEISFIVRGSGLCYLDSTFDKTCGFPGEGPVQPRKRSKRKNSGVAWNQILQRLCGIPDLSLSKDFNMPKNLTSMF